MFKFLPEHVASDTVLQAFKHLELDVLNPSVILYISVSKVFSFSVREIIPLGISELSLQIPNSVIFRHICFPLTYYDSYFMDQYYGHAKLSFYKVSGTCYGLQLFNGLVSFRDDQHMTEN